LDIGVNTSLCDDVLNLQAIIETKDKSIMTDDLTPLNIESTSNIGI
jgi:hypothetical protein